MIPLHETTSSRTLVLMRHAKAEVGSGVMSDRLRPLTPAGRNTASAAGRRLGSDGLTPDLLIVSAAVRTRQTAERVIAGLASNSVVTVPDDQLYSATVEDLLNAIRRHCEQAEDPRIVLVIGHEPTISASVRFLASEESDPAAIAAVRIGMSTASYAVLTMSSSWASLGKNHAVVETVVSNRE